MKTVCFLVKLELPDSAKPNGDPDTLSGSLGFIVEKHARTLYTGLQAARASVYPVACAFTQPGALCKHTVAELNEAAESEAA